MNLQPYRSSFLVFVADADLERGSQVTGALSNAGYSVEHRLTGESLFREIVKSPPHIILFFYQDEKFFLSKDDYQPTIEKIQKMLPETQIIFLCEATVLSEACRLFEYGIYDCVSWPPTNPMLLLRSVDRAAENDYYLYLNEQLKEKSSRTGVNQNIDFAMFNVWLKGLEKLHDRKQAIHFWMKEALRIFNTDEAIYFRYIETKKSIVAEDSVGINFASLQNVGLDLVDKEPGFHSKMLFEPKNIRAFHDFVLHGLRREQALYFPLVYDGQVLGVFFIPAKNGQIFSDSDFESDYLQTCLMLLQKYFYLLELKSKYKKFTVYDDESEALSQIFVNRKIKEEISRARRISRPVSLLQLSLDHFQDLVLQHSKVAVSKLLKSFVEILVKNSRLNDLVGRFEDDVFLLCLPHTDKQGAAIKADRLRRIIESADVTAILGLNAKISVSIGISEYPSICHDCEGLMQTADQAMLEAKKLGGNKICLAATPNRFTPDFIVKDGKSASTSGS